MNYCVTILKKKKNNEYLLQLHLIIPFVKKCVVKCVLTSADKPRNIFDKLRHVKYLIDTTKSAKSARKETCNMLYNL